MNTLKINPDSIEVEECQFKGTTTYCFNYKSICGYNYKVITPYGPSGNCQWFCIRNFAQFNNLDLDSARILLKKICCKVCKAMFMVDFHTYLLENGGTIKELLKDADFVINTEYLSTNGSKMTMMLVKTRKFIEDESK
jgi:hypothetical protein